MADRQKMDLLVSVARAYYEQGLTQDEIGSSMNISRSQVSRYLSEARDIGVVQFRIIDLGAQVSSLEHELMARFPGLQSATVLPLFSEDDHIARQTIGFACANYLRNVVHSGDCLGIGCGRTIRAAISVLKSHPVHNLSVVQVMGSLGHEALDIDFNELTRAAATAFSARAYYVNAPAILGSGTAADLEAANPSIRESLGRARTADIYLVGIGSLISDELYSRVGMLSPADMAWLKTHGAVGDICARFFDRDGCEYDTPFLPRIVGVSLADIRRARLSIGVAGGKDKPGPLLAALRGRWINVVITDEQTARALLKLDEDTTKEVS